MLRLFYSLLLIAVLPLIVLRLLWRSRHEIGYRQYIAERFGIYSAPPLNGSIWIHAVSVGEVRASAPLVAALRRKFPNSPILLTCTTPTGRRTAVELFGDTVTIVFLAYDVPFLLAGLFARFAPRIALVLETEIWPNMVACCRARAVPCLLVNARLSERSLAGYARIAPIRYLIRDALRSFSNIAAQSTADAERLHSLGALGASMPAITGNMKFDFVADAAVSARGLAWREGLPAGRGVALASSTREGEEALLLAAWRRSTPGSDSPIRAPLLVIVPRHPQRFDSVAKLAETLGFRVGRRSQIRSEAIDPSIFASIDVWLGDSMGELAAYYAMADVAIIGGSFLPLGGQNLIEAAAAGRAILMGPSTFNFADAARLATEAGALRIVQSADEAITSALSLLKDEPHRLAMGEAAIAFARAHAGATNKTVALIEQFIK